MKATVIDVLYIRQWFLYGDVATQAGPYHFFMEKSSPQCHRLIIFCRTSLRLMSRVNNGKRRERTVYPKKYAHGFVVLCFVVVMQSFIMNSHEVFIHIHQGCFAGTGAIVRLPQCQWSKPDGYGKISQCITTTKHSKAKTVCIFLGIYCTYVYISHHAWLHVRYTHGIMFCGSHTRAHDDVVKRRYFTCYWPFMMGIHRSPLYSFHKYQWRGDLTFSLNCAWTNDRANNRDLRRHRAHQDNIVMHIPYPSHLSPWPAPSELIVMKTHWRLFVTS